MATKQHDSQALPQKRHDSSSQSKKDSKQHEKNAATTCSGDLEQQNSSNKGKGPAGENL